MTRDRSWFWATVAILMLGLVAPLAAAPWHPGGASVASSAPLRMSGRTIGASVPTGPRPSASADPYGIVLNLAVGAAPFGAAYDSGKAQIFVANSNSDNVSVISDTTGRVVSSVTVGSGPVAAAYDAGRGEVFVANSNSGNVSVISDTTDRVVATVSVGGGPSGAVYDAAKGEVFVANFLDGTVSVVSDTTNGVVATVNVGLGPMGMAYDPGTGEVFVTNVNSNTVSVISDVTNTVAATVTVGQAPSGASYDAAAGEVYVANLNSSTVSVISDATDMVAATVNVGSGPLGVSTASAAGEIVIVNSRSGNASVISGATHTVVAWVNLFYGGSPVGVAYDSGNGGWYITDAAAGAVLIVAHGYSATFTESGLPAGTAWTLWVNGTSRFGTSHTQYSSTISTIRAVEPNATYSFAVGRVAGYGATPSAGSITVAGADVSQTITFSKLYTVTFAETGLPAGTSWSVTVAGVTKRSATATISFAEPNGTYAFTVGSMTDYSSSPASGDVNVTGADVSQAIAFAPSSTGTNAPGLFGLPGSTGLLIVAGIIAVVVIIGLVLVLRMRKGKTPPSQGAQPPSPGEPPA